MIFGLFFLSLSSFAATIIPFEREVSRISIFSFMSSNNHSSLFYANSEVGDSEDNVFDYGFSFENHGPNSIVPTTPESIDFASRDFSFVTDDHAKRDNYLWVTDYNGSGSVSDRFETIFVFLPRQNQMHIEEFGDDLLVTLPTGEEVKFSKQDRTMTSGVLKEEALDLNPNRAQRKFAQMSYTGTGLMIRSDARAADPRLAKNVQIFRQRKATCTLPAALFWTQEGFPKFKYVSDEEAFKVIAEKCN